MKKQRLMLIISVMLIAVMVFMPSYAKAATDEKLAVVNTSGNYLIYIDGLLNDEDGFEFALSNSKDETNLVYENSATDDAGNAVAYYDAANQKFADVDISKPVYVYVNGKKDMQGLEVNLTESITSEELDNIEKITKRIPVTTDESVEYSEDVDGLKVTTIVGSVRIEQDENNKNAKYSYQMVRLPANDERYNTLWDLLTEFNKDYNDMSVNEKINLSTEFSKLYTELINEAEWTEVKDKDLRIEQPEDAETGTQYILFLKEEVDGNITYDAQFLTSAQDPFENYENVIKEEQVVVKRTSKLPITGDSIALFIALAVIIVAIILVRRKMKKDSKH